MEAFKQDVTTTLSIKHVKIEKLLIYNTNWYGGFRALGRKLLGYWQACIVVNYIVVELKKHKSDAIH